MEASRPSARPHSSPRVTTALPSFTTMRLACFNSLRWAKDFPWGRGSETARNKQNHSITYETSVCNKVTNSTLQMLKITPVCGMRKDMSSYLHFPWENALMETEHTFGCRILEGRQEHKASLVNMTLKYTQTRARLL